MSDDAMREAHQCLDPLAGFVISHSFMQGAYEHAAENIAAAIERERKLINLSKAGLETALTCAERSEDELIKEYAEYRMRFFDLAEQVKELDAARLRAEAERDEALTDANIPKEFRSVGGITYCVWGTSSLDYVHTQDKRIAALETALRDVIDSPVEFADERVRYVSMQVDRADLDAARALLAAPKAT